jgi:hypothetical protein
VTTQLNQANLVQPGTTNPTPAILRTLLAFVAGGDEPGKLVINRIECPTEGWVAALVDGSGSILPDAAGTCFLQTGVHPTPREALEALEALCSDPAHLAALGDA